MQQSLPFKGVVGNKFEKGNERARSLEIVRVLLQNRRSYYPAETKIESYRMRRNEDSPYEFFRFPKNFKSSLALQVLLDTGLPMDKISPL